MAYEIIKHVSSEKINSDFLFNNKLFIKLIHGMEF
jgi:hypothetical protein